MWLYLLLVVLALVVIKLVNLSLFWSGRDLPYESFPRYLYRILWLFNRNVIFDVVREDVNRYGKVYGTFRGTAPSLIVADVEVVKEVLIKQFPTFFHRSFEFTTGDPIWDNILQNLPYERWKSVRTVMGHTFTTAKMRGMIPIVVDIAKRYGRRLQEISTSDDNELELKTILYGYSMDSMVAVSFGRDINNLENPENDFVKYGQKLFKPSVSIMAAFLFPKLLKLRPLLTFPPQDVTKFFGSVAQQVIREKKQNLDHAVETGRTDILDLHLIAQREDPKEHLTDEILSSQAFLFFIGGTDTSTVTMQLVTYFLATNTDAQQKAYDEVRAVLGDRTEVQYEDLQKMKFIEACVLESLRIVPVNLIVDRVAAEDTEVAGISVPKGMVIQFPLPYLHHDPNYFPEPEKFLPERFLKDGEISSETAAFLTFGDGPKACIGRRLALMIIQIFLAELLLRVRLEVCSRTPVPLQLTKGLFFANLFGKPPVLRLVPRESVSFSS